MRAGAYRAVLQYQTPDETPGPMGHPVKVWVTRSTHRGEVRKLTGGEALRAQVMTTLASHLIETRFPGYRFSTKSRLLDVTNPAAPQTYEVTHSDDPDGRRRELVTLATEQTAGVQDDASVIGTEDGFPVLQEDGTFVLV